MLINLYVTILFLVKVLRSQLFITGRIEAVVPFWLFVSVSGLFFPYAQVDDIYGSLCLVYIWPAMTLRRPYDA